MMRFFSRSTEVELEDVRVGRIRVRVQENTLDRIIGYFSPDALQRRLRARAALQGGSPPRGPRRGVIHEGVKLPKREEYGHWR
jgi:hypothetical protein